PALQRQFENYPPQNMLAKLQKMFEKPPVVEIYDLVDALYSCRQALGRDNKPKPQANKKVKGKGKADKNKQVVPYQPKSKPNPLKRWENPNKDQACHHCHVVGHWKRNCPLYLEELRVNKKSKPSAAGSAVEAIGMFDFVLPLGFVLKLNICYYAPSIVRCVVSFSCLLDLGFHHTIASNGISVSLNGIFYFSAISMNGVFEIDMNNNVSNNNNNSIFSIYKKRKLNLNSSYLWHCRLAHIGKTRIQKLHSEGLLENIDEESFDKCESCISGKMTKKPFNKNIERATDLLGLIHTDVYGPLRHVSRKCPIYFLTFTDDFSHYGYVFLLKHKHENLLLNMVPTKKVDKTSYEIWRAIEAYYDYEIWQMDVKTTFLNGRLDEDIYMEQPEGYVNPKYPNDVCKLQRAIYGLKQASRQWNKRFDNEIKSRYQQNPGKLHWVAVRHILKYLRNTKDIFLVYGGNPDTELEVTGFCNASWQCDKDDTKSKTGYVFVVNGGTVDWKSKKQTTIAMHATQSEYMAVLEAAIVAV
nr:hypothetical protein [Tanacetum cinerariifolium]